MDPVVIRMRCHSVRDSEVEKSVLFHPIESLENQAMTSGKPAGMTELKFDKGKPAAKGFEVGKDYSFTISDAK
jgi:hypothetical protein